ncbi:hypothetical protein Tco_1104517 [Tanacetum coccineum]
MDVSASFRSGRYNYVSGAKGFDWLALKLDLFAEEYRTGAVGSGSNPPPVTIHTWLERFNKQKPRSFEKAVAPTKLAVYKVRERSLAWWKAYKQAKGGDVWVLTLTWAAFKELFFLQFFPRAEQEHAVEAAVYGCSRPSGCGCARNYALPTRVRDDHDRSERTTRRQRWKTVITRTIMGSDSRVTVRVMTDRDPTGRDLTVQNGVAPIP